MLAVLGGTAEAALGAGGVLAALRALANSRALDTNAVRLGPASGAASHGASLDHFIQRRRKKRRGR